MAPARTKANRAGSYECARISTAAETLQSDFESLMGDVRKGLLMMKSLATELEKDKRSDLVGELEEAVVGLIETSDDCSRRGAAIKALGNRHRSGEHPMNLMEVLEEELEKIKGVEESDPFIGKSNPFIRRFREAVWNVHHAGQPMPGEEDHEEEIVVTNSQCNIPNTTCPLSGKPVTEIKMPVRNMECMHVYDKRAIRNYIISTRTVLNCPVAGCPKKLFVGKVYCDRNLLLDIEEMRFINDEAAKLTEVEDFTIPDED